MEVEGGEVGVFVLLSNVMILEKEEKEEKRKRERGQGKEQNKNIPYFHPH